MEAVYTTLLVLVLVALINKDVLATKHVVGGSQGWDESTDFSSWTSGETFKVGDQLVFKYTPLHSVVELGGESAYKSCDISSSLNSMNGGNNEVKLDKPGTRYFACGTAGHCDQGMKVMIKTVSADSTPAASSSSSSSSSTPTSTSAASVFHSFASFVLMAAFSIFYLLF